MGLLNTLQVDSREPAAVRGDAGHAAVLAGDGGDGEDAQDGDGDPDGGDGFRASGMLRAGTFERQRYSRSLCIR